MKGKSEKKDYAWVYVLLGMVCIIILIIVWLLYLLQGDTRTTSESEVIRSEAIACDGEGMLYPFFDYDGSNSKMVKINAVFNDDELDTIALTVKLYYDDAGQIERSNTNNHAAMNKSFASDALGADSLDAHYSNLQDAMQMTLYARAKDLNGVTSKYFLADGISNYSKDALTRYYNDRGLNCVVKN